MNLPNDPFLQHFRLIISTLSPVHIGCGEDYEPTNYVMDNQCLHYFHLADLADVLTDSDRKELNQINNDRDPLLRLQKFIASRKDMLVPLSRHSKPVAAEIYKKYERSVGQSANMETGGKSVINKLEIARTAFNPHSEEAMIPGSSIKGAIRTAVLNGLHGGKQERLGEREAGKLELKLLQGGFSEDPMRLIKLGDARMTDDKRVLYPRIDFENNIKRTSPKSDKPTRQLLSLMREVIPEFNYGAFHAELTVQDLLGVQADGVPKLQLKLERMIKSCNEFYLRIFCSEQSRFRNRGCLDNDWDNSAATTINLIEPFIAANKGMLLRIGRHSGAESVTLDGVRSIRIMQGPGKSPRYEPEATTDWLLSDKEKSETNLLPFGWVFLDFNHADMEAYRVKLRAHLHQASLNAYNQQESIFEEARSKRSQLEEQKQKLAAQAEERQQQELARQREERERIEALAAMSEEEQSIERILERIARSEGKNQGPGSDLARDVATLCDQASAWQPHVRDKLHKTALVACQHMGIDPKKNDKWKKRLRALVNQ